MPIVDPAEFTAALTARDVNVGGLAIDDRGTLAGSARSTSQSKLSTKTSSSSPSSHTPLSAAESLSSLTVPSAVDADEITVTGLLSKGGMGEVMLGHQRSLGREVAVKRHRGDPKRERELVIEGRLTGQLEHPNIVPVHTMLDDADGRPMVVMKRVEGDTWRAMLNDPNVPFERHLSIFDDVCHALAFAHARGVAHCDVKPANVMVGRFGEVYVVDWGIAVGFGDSAIADVPHVSTLKGVFGTPKYLAPEMALPGSGPIDGRTDVYIMGAILYELATRRPLRTSKVIAELLHHAHMAAPPTFEGEDVDGGVDPELQAIIKTALARHPAERFQSVEAMRVAVKAFAAGGSARALLRRSEETLQALKGAVADGKDPLTIRRLAIESRFGFQSVLTENSSHQRALAGLSDVLATMVQFELDADALVAAQTAFDELKRMRGAPGPYADATIHALGERLAALARQHQHDLEAVSALQRFRAEQDPSTAERERAVFLYGAGAAWFSTMVFLDQLDRRLIVQVGPGAFSLFMASFAGVLGISALAFPVLRKTAASRGLLITMVSCVLGLSVVHGVGFLRGIDAATMLAVGHTLWAVTAAQLATSDKRLWPATAVCAVSVPLLLMFGDEALIVSGLVGFLILADIARRWRRRPSGGA
jgi:serine/threonine-protein kinase